MSFFVEKKKLVDFRKHFRNDPHQFPDHFIVPDNNRGGVFDGSDRLQTREDICRDIDDF